MGFNTDIISADTIYVSGNSITPKYKVYTALLTQSGNDNQQILTIGNSLTIGVTYVITDDGTGYILGDFTNVGAPNNELGTSFVAIGTIPNDWGTDITLLYNTGAPIVTVLENTIGDILWTYISPGEYLGTLLGSFPIDKTFIIIGDPFSGGNNGYCFASYYDTNSLVVYSASGPNKVLDASNNILEFTPIEIRVYN